MLDKYLGEKKESKAHKYVSKVLICLIIFLLSLIGISISDKVKNFYQKYIFTDSFSFMKVQNFFKELNGKEEYKEESLPVMQSFISYEKKTKYLNGEKYEGVRENYLNALANGIVTFIGEKQDYGKTIIIQGSNGYDIWYFNIEDSDLMLYDYVKKSSIIASISGEFGLVITKDNKYYTFEEYVNALS